jgi:hypothetical protein
LGPDFERPSKDQLTDRRTAWTALSAVLVVGALAGAGASAASAALVGPRPVPILRVLRFHQVRYATPNGSSSPLNPCNDSGNPCTLQHALDTAVGGFDEVVVEPGNYSFSSTLTVSKRLYIHGVLGQPRPRLVFSQAYADSVRVESANTTIRYLEIQSVGVGLRLKGRSDTARELLVHTSAPINNCTGQADSVTFVDTACESRGIALWLFQPTQGQAEHFTVRNVTAVGGRGIFLEDDHCGCDVDATVVNTIARGQGYDVETFATSPGTAKAFLSYSNYDRAHSNEGGNSLIWNSGNNQSVLPHFLNAPPPFPTSTTWGTDFHQAADSPTVNAGQTDDASNGPFDFDGDGRTLGTSTDIGADELVPFAQRPANTSTKSPVISSVFLGAGTFAINGRGPAVKPAAVRRIAVGTVVNYTLSKAARVKLIVQDSRSRLVGRFAQLGRPGPNSKPWSGKIGRKTLSPGSYRVTLVATDSRGRRSHPRALGFRVISP